MKLLISKYDCINADDIPEQLAGAILGAHHQGRCDDDAEFASKFIDVDDEDYLKLFLSSHGAWDDDELLDHEVNLERLVWLMAGDIKECGEFYYGS